MVATPALRSLVREGKTFQMATYLQLGMPLGMQTMAQAVKQLLQEGLVRAEDVRELAVQT